MFFYPGMIYEIDSDGPLAALKMGKAHLFEFDRNMTKNDAGEVVVKDYSCKRCGLKCKSLAELGRHANATHNDDDLMPEDPS